MSIDDDDQIREKLLLGHTHTHTHTHTQTHTHTHTHTHMHEKNHIDIHR